MDDSLDTSQLLESLATPRMVPRITVITMPMKETFKVLRAPTIKARPYELAAE